MNTTPTHDVILLGEHGEALASGVLVDGRVTVENKGTRKKRKKPKAWPPPSGPAWMVTAFLWRATAEVWLQRPLTIKYVVYPGDTFTLTINGMDAVRVPGNVPIEGEKP